MWTDTLLCITCDPAAQAGIFDASFWPRMLAMATPFLALGLVALWLDHRE